MTFMAVLPWLAGIGSAVAGYLGAKEQASAIKEAGRQKQASLEKAREEYAPYRKASLSALERYQKLLGLKPLGEGETQESLLARSPYYQQMKQETLEGVERGLAGAGLLGSGRGARILGQEAQRFAFGQYGQQMGGLGKLANIDVAKQLADIASAKGGVSAEQRLGLGQARAGLYQNVASSFAPAIQHQLYRNLFEGLLEKYFPQEAKTK